MKRLVLVVSLFFALEGHALAQFPFPLTVTPPAFTSSLLTQATPTPIVGTGATYFSIGWWTQGTVSAGACVLKGAADRGFTTAVTTIISAQTVTSSGGAVTPVSANPNFVKVDCSTSGGGTSITGGGNVTVTIYGFTAIPVFINASPTPPNSGQAQANADTVRCPTDVPCIVGGNGTAGSPDTHVVTAQGATGGTPMPVSQPACNNKPIEPAASDNHQVIQNGATTLCSIVVFNNSATVNYGRVYNAGTGFNGCNSATNLAYEFQIPASTSVGGFVVALPQGGVSLSSGLSICITGGYGQTDTTNATATAISANFGYR